MIGSIRPVRPPFGHRSTRSRHHVPASRRRLAEGQDRPRHRLLARHRSRHRPLLRRGGRERRHQLPQQGAAGREARRPSCARSASRRSSSGADLTDPESVQAMFDEVERAFGGLDILVLNASGGMESGHGRGLRAAAQPRRAGVGARDGAAAARRRLARRVRDEPPGALHPHHADDARVRAGRAVQARRRGRAARADPGARRARRRTSSSSRAT